jgi:hypothetical protein
MPSAPKSPPKSAALRVAAHRKRMRDAGYVQKTLWVPDLTNPGVLAEIRRQCQAIAASPEGPEVMEWMEAMQADLDLGPIPEYRLPDKE